jgi:hypothetical protein
MSIFAAQKEEQAPKAVLFNTGTLYDLMTGSWEVGYDGKFYLNGGFGASITGIHGGGNMYKSTYMDSLITGALLIYRDAEEFVKDTEGSKKVNRIASFMANPLFKKDPDLAKRITVRPQELCDINNTWKFIDGICKAKEANRRTQMVETPFLDLDGKSRLKVWIPTFVFVDSLTEMESMEEGDMVDGKGGMEDKKNKTIWLLDGNKKTLLVRHMRKKAAEYGICFVCSAHKGDNTNLDSYAPPTKQLQFMKQSDRIKGVGSRFEFLTHVLTQTASAKLLLDSSKAPLFPHGKTSETDLNELLIIAQRNKYNGSGLTVNPVVSQEHGLLNTVSNLYYLRQSNYRGLIGGPSNPKHACVWYPDVKFSRNTIREQCKDDYALNRAIELTAQFTYIQNNYNLAALPEAFSWTHEQVYEALIAKGTDMKALMETTGHWSYLEQDREYTSIFDILMTL